MAIYHYFGITTIFDLHLPREARKPCRLPRRRLLPASVRRRLRCILPLEALSGDGRHFKLAVFCHLRWLSMHA